VEFRARGIAAEILQRAERARNCSAEPDPGAKPRGCALELGNGRFLLAFNGSSFWEILITFGLKVARMLE
jgi:hypothetical protein